MENPVISGRIQMERFISVEIFRNEGNNFTFRDITFFPFLQKRPKFFVPFVWLTQAHSLPGVLQNSKTLTHSSFRKRFQV